MIAERTFTVYADGRVPVKSWATQIEDGALEQARNLSNLPFAISHVALMPDAHQGYGMPIGGVLFADRAVVPYAVGVDIGCGVALIETDLTVEDIDHDEIIVLLNQIARDIPVGNGPRGQHAPREVASVDLWEIPDILGEEPSANLLAALGAAELQLGSLGGGNHFLELQRDQAGRIWFMLHSGSRSVGKKTCDYWHRIALLLCKRWYSNLPDNELAFLPWDSEEAHGYFTDMQIAMAWAEENRRRMAGKVIGAFGRHTKGKAWQVLDIHHNYAAWENHRGKNGIVHRKGSVRARAGEQVLIPGSMGTASYVGRGLGNPDSFESCQHGAGRARSRADTRRSVTLAQMNETLEEVGVVLVTPDRASVIDESPAAYKDIESVMEASRDLVEPTLRLTPLGVVKG